MRVLHYLETVDRSKGGVVTAALDMVEALTARGVDVDLLTGQEVDAAPAWRAGETAHLNFTVDPALICRYRPPEDLRAKVRPMLQRADLLHLHGVWNPLHRFLAAEARAQGVPYVVTLHGMLDYWSMQNGGRLKQLKKQVFLKLFGKTILEGAAAIQCTAELEAQAARHFLPRLKTRVLPYIFKPDGLLEIERRPPPPEAEGGFAPAGGGPRYGKLLFLSRLHVKKRPDLLIAAAEHLPGYEIQLAGPIEPGYEAELRQLAESRGVADRVRWLGMLRGEAKHAAYAEADVFVLPTSQENFGIVLVEAMAAAMPVVTTRGTAIWGDLESAGAWIVPQEIQAIVRACGEINADPPATHARALRGREWVRDTLLAEALTPRYLELYQSLLSHREPRPETPAGASA